MGETAGGGAEVLLDGENDHGQDPTTTTSDIVLARDLGLTIGITGVEGIGLAVPITIEAKSIARTRGRAPRRDVEMRHIVLAPDHLGPVRDLILALHHPIVGGDHTPGLDHRLVGREIPLHPAVTGYVPARLPLRAVHHLPRPAPSLFADPGPGPAHLLHHSPPNPSHSPVPHPLRPLRPTKQALRANSVASSLSNHQPSPTSPPSSLRMRNPPKQRRNGCEKQNGGLRRVLRRRMVLMVRV